MMKENCQDRVQRNWFDLTCFKVMNYEGIMLIKVMHQEIDTVCGGTWKLSKSQERLNRIQEVSNIEKK